MISMNSASEILQIEIPDELGKKLSVNDIIEVVTRAEHSRIDAITKVRVLSNAQNKEDKVSEIAQQFVDKWTRSDVAHSINEDLKNAQNGLHKISKTTADMANHVEEIYKHAKGIQAISCLNTGLSLANLAVDIAGFAVVCSKLSRLEEDIKSLQKIAVIQQNEKLAKFHENIMSINDVKDSIINSKGKIDATLMDKMQKLLRTLDSYMSEMISNLFDKAFGTETVLKIIFTILPGYTAVLYSFIKEYYFINHSLPSNYDNYLKVFDKLSEPAYRESLIDYFMLDRQMHALDAYDAFFAQVLIGLNDRTQIEDLVILLKATETREAFEALDSAINNKVESELKNVAQAGT